MLECEWVGMGIEAMGMQCWNVNGWAWEWFDGSRNGMGTRKSFPHTFTLTVGLSLVGGMPTTITAGLTTRQIRQLSIWRNNSGSEQQIFCLCRPCNNQTSCESSSFSAVVVVVIVAIIIIIIISINVVRFSFHGWLDWTAPSLEKTQDIQRRSQNKINCPIRRSVSRSELRGDWVVKKRGQISHCLTPVKIRGGVGEISESSLA